MNVFVLNLIEYFGGKDGIKYWCLLLLPAPPLPLLLDVEEPSPPRLLLFVSGTVPSFCSQPNHQYPAGRGNGGSALSI